MYSKAKEVKRSPRAPFQTLIRDMKKGEKGWAVPWAYDKHGYLDLAFTVIPERLGTSNMLVVCHGYDDYDVRLNDE